MRPFQREHLSSLLTKREGPCLTLCMPTAGRPPESTGDAVRYGNLMKQARAALEEGGAGDTGRRLMAQLEDLGTGNGDAASPRQFWNSGRKGLAVFAAANSFEYYRVGIELPELVHVGESFHVKPMLPLLYDDVRFHVLALARNHVTLYEGDAHSMHELPLDGVPQSMEEAVGRDFDDSHQGRSFHGSPDHSKRRTGGTGTAEGTGTHFHGYGDADRELEKDMERFLREVDRGLVEKYANATRLPMVVVAVDKHLGHYRVLSKHPNLVAGGVASDPASLSTADMHERAHALVRPAQEQRLTDAIDAFGAASAHGSGASDLSEVARAAVEGRIGRLVLERGRSAWGRIDRTTGSLDHAQGPGQGAEDLYDEIAEITLLKGGDVLLAERGRLTTPTGVAAVFRY